MKSANLEHLTLATFDSVREKDADNGARLLKSTRNTLLANPMSKSLSFHSPMTLLLRLDLLNQRLLP